MVIKICCSECDVYCVPVVKKEWENPDSLCQCHTVMLFAEEPVRWPLYTFSLSEDHIWAAKTYSLKFDDHTGDF